ncbi:hypothetical protein ACOMHN_054828 [Nucella lapillus]
MSMPRHPHSTLSSIEDWFTLQGHTLDWKQRELDYAYADHYDQLHDDLQQQQQQQQHSGPVREPSAQSAPRKPSSQA